MTEIPTDTHYAVGPYNDMYGHGPVTVMSHYVDTDDERAGFDAQLWVCLDCGYVAGDNRMLLDVDCDREMNPINQTWRERGFED